MKAEVIFRQTGEITVDGFAPSQSQAAAVYEAMQQGAPTSIRLVPGVAGMVVKIQYDIKGTP